jgi:superfamily I DNA/RNA helicase
MYLTRWYESFKRQHNLVDFYDCLLQFRDRGEPLNVKAAFIDEAQDLTPLQWEVCRIAFSKCEKIRVAGDDYQSIFTYAGASPETLIALSKKHRTIKLEKSYRIPKSVYDLSKGITLLIDNKVDKDYRPVKKADGFVKTTANRDELALKIQRDLDVNGYTPHRWFLLFRNNCFFRDMEDRLTLLKIPYHSASGFCVVGRDMAKIKRYYNYRKLGYGSKEAFETFCKEYYIKDIHDSFTESALISSDKRYLYAGYVDKYGADGLYEMSKKEPCVLLSTVHRVKGGEADYVAVFADCTRQVDMNRQVDPDEELRVLYVACTRARQGLYIVSRNTQYGLDDMLELIKEA